MALAADHDVIAWIIFCLLIAIMALYLWNKMMKCQFSFTSTKGASIAIDCHMGCFILSMVDAISSSETQHLKTILSVVFAYETLVSASTRPV